LPKGLRPNNGTLTAERKRGKHFLRKGRDCEGAKIYDYILEERLGYAGMDTRGIWQRSAGSSYLAGERRGHPEDRRRRRGAAPPPSLSEKKARTSVQIVGRSS